MASVKSISDCPIIHTIGDQALMIMFGDGYSKQVNSKVLEFDRKLSQADFCWIVEVVPAIRSLLVTIDPLYIEMQKAEHLIREQINTQQESIIKTATRRFEIPVCYGSQYSPDLEHVSLQTGVNKEKLIELHCSCDLSVACLGFSPGLAYLAELPEEFNLPRKVSYNATALPGSVLVANRQTVFTATAIPTGWSIIGRSPVIGFRLNQSPHFLFQPGDEIRFYPITEEQFQTSNYDKIWDTYGHY